MFPELTIINVWVKKKTSDANEQPRSIGGKNIVIEIIYLLIYLFAFCEISYQEPTLLNILQQHQ